MQRNKRASAPRHREPMTITVHGPGFVTARFATKPATRSASRRCTLMAETKSAKNTGFTAEEKAAMKARAQELKAEARANRQRADGESDVLTAIAAMAEPDRGIAKRLHAIVSDNAPVLSP